MNIIELLIQFKAILHTFVRILPLGLYSFAYLLSAVFKDARGGLILLGLIINDIVGYLYKTYFNFIPNDNCAIFGNMGKGETLGFLPNAHEEVIAFFTAFIFSNMWDEFTFDLIPFVFLIILCLLTGWSRVSIGCSKMKDVLFHFVTGMILGIVYYFFVGSYYMKEKRGKLEKETCDFGYDNYRCAEIKDGTVILKGKKMKKDVNETKFTDEENNYYNS